MKKVLTLSKSICRTTLFFLVALAMSSCIDERIDDGSSIAVQEGIRLSIADVNDVAVYSTAAESENRIEDCAVIVVRTGAIFHKEVVDVSKIIGNGYASPILPSMTKDSKTFTPSAGDKVYVVCNTGVTDAILNTITSESDINTVLKPTKDYYVGGDALPMSGVIASYSSSASYVNVTRAVAKITIKFGTSVADATSDFSDFYTWGGFSRINGWEFHAKVVNYPAKASIMESSASLSQNTTGQVAHYRTTDYMLMQQQDSVLLWIGGDCWAHTGRGTTIKDYTIYIAEYPNSTKDSEGNTVNDGTFDKKRLCLQLIPTFMIGSCDNPGNSREDFGAYRLDFYDAIAKKFLDIKRNFHYTFTVNKIRSNSYLTDHGINVESLNNPGSNIEYTVIVEDPGFKQVVSDGQYALLLESDEIEIEGTTGTLRFSTVIPSGVDASQITTHNVMAFDKNGNQVGSAGQALEFTSPAQRTPSYTVNGTPQSVSFKINNLSLMNGGFLEVRLGNILKKIMIKYVVAARARVVWMNGSSTDPADCVIKYVSPTVVSGATDLSASGTSNCYVVISSSEDKTYCFDANTMGNGASGVTALNGRTALAGASMTVGGLTVYKDAHISDDLAGAKVYFTVSKNKTGNALIAVMDNSNTVRWSWHIWIVQANEDPRTAAHTQNYTFTSTNVPPTGVSYNGAPGGSFNASFTALWPTLPSLDVMDRNLGAMTNDPANGTGASCAGFNTAGISSNSMISQLTHGLVYCWGLPIPMPGTIGSDPSDPMNGLLNHYALASGAVTATLVTGAYASQNSDIATSVANPLLGPKAGTGFAPYSISLWGASPNYQSVYTYLYIDVNSTAKSVFDPCPYGYCMPPGYFKLRLAEDYTASGGVSGSDRYVYYQGLSSGPTAFYPGDAFYRYAGHGDGGAGGSRFSFSSSMDRFDMGGGLANSLLSIMQNGSFLNCSVDFNLPVRCVRE